MKQNRNRTIAVLTAAILLFTGVASSVAVLFDRMAPYNRVEFYNVLPLVQTETPNAPGQSIKSLKYGEVGNPDFFEELFASSADPSAPETEDPASTPAAETPSEDESASMDAPALNDPNADEDKKPEDNDPSGGGNTGGNTTGGGTSDGKPANPQFVMEAEAEIFKLFYDETGKITVIGPEGNTDKLIAPGTSNLYQFTLKNPGNVTLDYTLTMEAFITGTDLWIPVYVRVWDYTNKYLVGSADEQVDVLELNKVDEKAALGAGKNAVYYLEWEWPFERVDENGSIVENDIYDTMLGNLAVDEDLVLHIIIRTYAEYDEEPGPGIDDPPQTGDAGTIALALVAVGSFTGLFLLIIFAVRRRREEKQGQV